MKTFHAAFVALALLLVAGTASARARLVIQNRSQREMTVKVLKIAGADEALQGTTSVEPFGTQTVYFSVTGDYFLKTMATLAGREPLYRSSTMRACGASRRQTGRTASCGSSCPRNSVSPDSRSPWKRSCDMT